MMAAVAVAQDREREKTFIASQGLPVGPFAVIAGEADIGPALEKVKLPALLKTARFGYDGKGQAAIASREEGRAVPWLPIWVQTPFSCATLARSRAS